ncbi:MAG: hypothetical protein LKF52_01235 [Butyrivibrio sp.]|jgi:hypothetical protein|nr:hypothetical protein [Butyrivibrio sp.]
MDKKSVKVSIYHMSEIFLYEYYVNHEDYEISSADHAAEYVKLAEKDEQEGHTDKALQNYLKAHFENPVSAEIYHCIIKCCRQLGDLRGFYQYTLESYDYCCTRAELAGYYRNLGYYYLENYKPELAAALYRYSIFFYKSEQAESEIEFLNKAMNRLMAQESAQEIQRLLRKEKIPIQANQISLALLVKAGEEAEEKKMSGQAMDCYKMVYDLTQDEEIKNRIYRLKDNGRWDV